MRPIILLRRPETQRGLPWMGSVRSGEAPAILDQIGAGAFVPGLSSRQRTGYGDVVRIFFQSTNHVSRRNSADSAGGDLRYRGEHRDGFALFRSVLSVSAAV